MDENDIGREVVDAAIAVHREIGPGLLETVSPSRSSLGDLGVDYFGVWARGNLNLSEMLQKQ